MDFSGPEPADFANVESLNHAFLLQLRGASRGQHLRQEFSPSVQSMVRGLTDLQIERLSATPFLLLSLRECDAGYWRDLCGDDRNAGLFVAVDRDIESGYLSAAALAFLWQLALRNPYAARLVSGATLSWCEQLADGTLLQLLQRTTGRRDLLQPRLAGNTAFWNKLLGPGLSSEQEVRKAAHLAALQAVLTGDPATQYRPLRAAACRSSAPSRQVAGRTRRR